MNELKIGIITDLQYADLEPDLQLNRYFRNSLQKIDKIIPEFNNTELDFIVNLGDTIDQGFENFDVITQKLAQFQAPLINLAGNHDFDVEVGSKTKVHGRLNIQKNYHSFDKNGLRFCFLDGNEISTFANKKNSPYHGEALELIKFLSEKSEANANDWNGGIGKKQLEWLEQNLLEAEKENLKVVAFCHYPIFPGEKHSLLNCTEVIALAEKYSCLKAWFCGHHHKGNYGQINRCHIVNFKGIVDYEFDNTYALADISKEKIVIRGFGREIDRHFNI